MSSRQSIHMNGLTINVVYNVENNTLSLSVAYDPNGHDRNVQLTSVELFNVPPCLLILDNTNQPRTVLPDPDLTPDTTRPPGRPASSDDQGPERRVRPRSVSTGTDTDTDVPIINSMTNPSGPITSRQYVPFVISANSSAPLYPREDWLNLRRNLVAQEVQHVDPYQMVDQEILPLNVPEPLPLNIIGGGLTEEQIMACLRPTKYCCNLSEKAELECCCICQEEYVPEEDVSGLRCNHVFHSKCIKSWLMQDIICPVCRAYVMEE